MLINRIIIVVIIMRIELLFINVDFKNKCSYNSHLPECISGSTKTLLTSTNAHKHIKLSYIT